MDDEAPRGVPEWVVTYGDMMSLLLTFFIMLVSLSEVVADKRYRAVLESLHRYIGYRSAPSGPPGRSFPLNSLISQLESLGAHVSDPDRKGHGGVKKLAIEGEDLRVFTTREGTEVRVGDPVFFAPGQALLSNSAQAQLEVMSATRTGALAGYPNKIEIRAYASHAPLPPDASHPNKVLLTYARARAVLDFLQSAGVARERLRIGVAAGLEPEAIPGDRNVERFDRVEVYMLDAFASEYVGPKDAPR
jgi:chemotaxis protein MotB